MSSDSPAVSVRDLLAGYDRQVEEVLQETLDTRTGSERVQLLHRLRRSVSVHDSVVRSVLCPLLEELPEGPAVAQRLCRGCEERSDLLQRFHEVTTGVAAGNVYTGSGAEVEAILEGLERSFRRHEREETDDVTRLLEASSTSTDPQVITARMALAADRAPTRSHPGATVRAKSAWKIRRDKHLDRFRDWIDTHHGWVR
jgi:hypothetical protein